MIKFPASVIPILAMAGMLTGLDAALAQTTSRLPESGFYVGLGGSYNSLDFGTQDVYAVGTSDVYQNGVKVKSGSAEGPADLYPGNQSGFAPTVQLGYFQHIAATPWVWGAKFSFSYLGQTATLDHVLLPQVGAFTYTQSQEVVPFNGNALVGSYQTSIREQLAIVPLIGHAFSNGFAYFGAGPSLSNVSTKLNSLIGFADINGNRTDVSGAPLDFSASKWILGGAMTVGATYFLTPSLFLDTNYALNLTAKATQNFAGPFTNSNGANDSVTTGTMVGNAAGNVLTQGISVTIDEMF